MITLTHLSLNLGLPERMIISLEKEGLPVTFIGKLRRYEYGKVRKWYAKRNETLYNKSEQYYVSW